MANEMLVAALAYAKRGWPIFPVKADKTPYTANGVNDATTDPAIIEHWWDAWPTANIGLNVGEASMMVLDYDPGFNIEELEKNVGQIPRTDLSCRTPRGGRHVYLLLHDGEIVAASASKLAPHCDVRSFHSYVLLPPSRTKDGAYTWEEDGKPALRSDELLRLANAGRERHEDHDTWIIEADLPENVARAVEWLQRSAKVAVDGQGGDLLTYSTAAMCKSYGLSEGTALELMWEHWWPRCSPPWLDEEGYNYLATKVENGYAYNTSPPGNITPAYRTAKSAILFKAVEKVETEVGTTWVSGHFRYLDSVAIDNIPPPVWLVEKVLAEGSYAMLYGQPSTYKTFIALDLALTIAAGFAINSNWLVARSGKVAFVAGEGHAGASKRVKAWRNIHMKGERVKNFYLVDPVPKITEEPKAFVAGLLDISAAWSLVVLDTVGRAMQGTDENSQENASAFTSLVEHIIRETGATVLAIHHTGKDDKRGARGSSVFGADADTMIHLIATKTPRLVSMDMTKQKDAEPWAKPQMMHLKTVSDSLVPTKTDAPKTAADDGEALMVDLIEAAALNHLARIREKAYSDRQLAKAVAADVRVTVKEDAVRLNYLPILRSESARRVSKCYDSVNDRWRWHTEAEK